MSNETTLTVHGIIGTDPRTFSTGNQTPGVSFRLAATERVYNRQTQQWEDGHTNWFDAVAYDTLATTIVAAGLGRGTHVTATGTLRVKPWTRGEKSGTNIELTLDHVGIDLRRTKPTEQPTPAPAPTPAAQPAPPVQQSSPVTEWDVTPIPGQ